MDSRLPELRFPRARLREGAVEWAGSLPGTVDVWSAAGIAFTEPVELSLRLEPSADGGVHLTGRLEGGARAECRRCLADLSLPVTIDLDLWFEPSVAPGDEEEGVYALDPRAESLDVTAALREEVLLALPEYAECRPDCRGLCRWCGADLNEGPCGCAPADMDPRWERLRDLRTGGAKAEDRVEAPEVDNETRRG